MKSTIFFAGAFILSAFFITAASIANAQKSDTPASSASSGLRYQPESYTPESKALYDTIVRMDSIYFDTYNTCKLEKMAALTSDSLEFYHDRMGFMTSKR